MPQRDLSALNSHSNIWQLKSSELCLACLKAIWAVDVDSGEDRLTCSALGLCACHVNDLQQSNLGQKPAEMALWAWFYFVPHSCPAFLAWLLTVNCNSPLARQPMSEVENLGLDAGTNVFASHDPESFSRHSFRRIGKTRIWKVWFDKHTSHRSSWYVTYLRPTKQDFTLLNSPLITDLAPPSQKRICCTWRQIPCPSSETCHFCHCGARLYNVKVSLIKKMVWWGLYQVINSEALSRITPHTSIFLGKKKSEWASSCKNFYQWQCALSAM